MQYRIRPWFVAQQHRLRNLFTSSHLLAFLPALVLASFWLGGEVALLMTALGLPVLFAFSGGFDTNRPHSAIDRDHTTGLSLRGGLETALAHSMNSTRNSNLDAACFMLDLDEFDSLRDRHGHAGCETLLKTVTERLRQCLRDHDMIAKLGDSRFGISLSPAQHLDVETAIQTAVRIQSIIEEPISLDATTIHLSCSIGFCLASRCPDHCADTMIEAAATALHEANCNAPSSIRMYSDEMRRKQTSKRQLLDDVEIALENGHIQPWFQPQISTDTGRVTGFEALARLCHPERGMIAPAEFLPTLEQMGRLERLGEVILYHALGALRAWDAAGIEVPRIGVNFTSQELRNPKLIDKLTWELDRFNIAPNRLSIEVLETVVATSSEDIVARNISGLSSLGCGIDLDDFGTGHASISSIRRFAIDRLKIDRAFVMKVDRDGEQQRMVAAILTMAERLGLDTLAEGVESVGEHTMLAQLGCRHVQGFGIARPMPFDRTIEWIHSHNAKLANPPGSGGKSAEPVTNRPAFGRFSR